MFDMCSSILPPTCWTLPIRLLAFWDDATDMSGTALMNGCAIALPAFCPYSCALVHADRISFGSIIRNSFSSSRRLAHSDTWHASRWTPERLQDARPDR